MWICEFVNTANKRHEKKLKLILDEEFFCLKKWFVHVFQTDNSEPDRYKNKLPDYNNNNTKTAGSYKRTHTEVKMINQVI